MIYRLYCFPKFSLLLKNWFPKIHLAVSQTDDTDILQNYIRRNDLRTGSPYGQMWSLTKQNPFILKKNMFIQISLFYEELLNCRQ